MTKKSREETALVGLDEDGQATVVTAVLDGREFKHTLK
jgi:hypothetical protein